jgi:hypothetical protein
MKKLVFAGCFYLVCIAGFTQTGNRVRSGNNLRWAMSGSTEIMEGDLVQHYGTSDSAAYKRNNTVTISTTASNPRVTHFSSVQGQCDNNSMVLSWVAIQQPGTERYEIEHSPDGVSDWKVVGSVLANKTQTGASSYSFNYYKNAANLFFRVAVISNSGERLSSSIFKSPCSVNSFLSIVPNPIYNTAILRIGSSTTERVRLMIVDTRGAVVQRRDATLSQGANSLTLNMSGLTTGYYSVAIQRMSGKQDVLNVFKQ